MCKLPFLILGLLFSINVIAQKSPHGDELLNDCSECHSTGSWLVNTHNNTFDHNQTGFSLIGQHQQIDCKMCHLSLNFSAEKGKSACVSCHLDVHQQLLGNDCEECHSLQTWIVRNVKEIHFNSRFPLTGPHANADCFECHLTENLLQFRPLGVECNDCHSAEYLSTTSPNHVLAGYSIECFDCHNMLSADWSSDGFEHGFFPLNGGHAINDCAICHISGNFETISADCESCHIDDYNNALDPPHLASNFSTDCTECHTINAWTPSTFDHDALYFPIYSGEHQDEWNSCTDCHTNSGNYTLFSCIDCHEHNRADMDDEHSDENGYVYASINCFDCHPNGTED
ncbi:MAG: hypothetical protein PF484_09765 [Bacteroidales bacterium]|jgi:hypothetical protein|nr:hypothetical protein [Bacteroidales bacterium]